MSDRLTLTTAGRAALTDPAHVATRAVTVTRVGIGTGTAPAGTDESARSALRAQVDIAAAGGLAAQPAGTLDIRSRHTLSSRAEITEVGVFARIGAGAEFLLAYWAGASASDAIAVATPGSTIVLFSYLRFAAESSTAQINLTAAVDLHVGTTPATTTARGIVELATAAEVRTGTDAERAVTPAALAAVGNVVAADHATTTARGIVELATAAEAEAGADAERAVTPAALAAALAALATRPPAGVVMAFSGDAIPTGYLELDGQAVSRVTYAALWDLYGTTYGAGDGATTFNLPNLARRTILGAGGVATAALGNEVGDTGGAETHALGIAEMPRHSHTGATAAIGSHTHGPGTYRTDLAPAHTHAIDVGFERAGSGDDINTIKHGDAPGPSVANSRAAGAHSHTLASGRSGSGGGHTHGVYAEGAGRAHSILQPSIVMRWIVSTGP